MIKIRIPKNFFDELPPAPPYIPVTRQEDEDDTQSDSGSIFRTACDSYGILREYPCGKPSITPDNHHSISNISDSPNLSLDPSQSHPSSSSSSSQSHSGIATQKLVSTNIYEPFQNASTFHLMDWFYRPSLTKSIAELNTLVK